MTTEVDMVNAPPHYTNRQHECIDEMVAVFGVDAVIAHCKCCAWKYRYRANSKGNYDEDTAKSDWYINKMMELQGEKRRNGAVVERYTEPKTIPTTPMLEKALTGKHRHSSLRGDVFV